jgi:hypothetical protein
MVRVFLIIFLFISVILKAQSFVASVDNNKVGENDRFEVSFTFEGKNINDLKNFSPPSFKDFRILSGPNQSTSMQIINGVASSTFTLSYILMPNTTGSFTIGSASIQYQGNTFKTEPLKITIVKGSQKPDDQKSSGISNEEIAKNLFIRASIDKNRIYQGEQVTVTYKLYTRLNIAAQMSVDKLPQYQGFWAEEIETSRNIAFTTEVVDGKQYRVGILKKAALFPNQSGKLEVTPLELTIPIQIQKKKNPNNIWDDFFGDPFGRSEIIEYPTKSNTVKVDVLPLPENNKPDSFKGAVGRYDFTATIDKSKLKTNEPVSLKFNITGTGNIKLLELPDFQLPNGFEKYDPKIEEQINRTGKISGSKKAEYLLIPRIPGTREIPAIEFSYFDTERKTYQTLKSKSFSLSIEKGEAGPVDIAQQNITQVESDIRYIKTSFKDIDKRTGLILESTGFWVASILPLLFAIGLIIWKRKQDKLYGNQQLLRYTKAEKVARSRFKKTKKFLEKNEVEQFYTEISQALFGYLEDKLHISKSEFTLEKAADELAKRNISQDIISKMKTNAEKCEFIRFAPSTNPSAAMNEMYKSLSEVVIDIERSISK